MKCSHSVIVAKGQVERVSYATPIVAGAFHPALAPVGALMGIAGYVLGTYAGLICAWLLRTVHQLQ